MTKEMNKKVNKSRVERHICRKGNRYVVMIQRKGLERAYWGSFPDLASARAKRDEVLALPEAGVRVSPVTDNPHIVSSIRAQRSTGSTPGGSTGGTRRVERHIYRGDDRYEVHIRRKGLSQVYWGRFPDLASARVRCDEVLARAEAGWHHAAPAPAPTPTQKAKTTSVERHIYHRGNRYEVVVNRKGLPKQYWGSFRKLSSARAQRDAVVARAEAAGLIIDRRKAKTSRVERHIHRKGDRYEVKIQRNGLERAYWGSFPDRPSARRRRDEVLARAYAEGLIIDRRKAKTDRVDRNIYYRNNQYLVEINRKGLPKQYWGIFPNLASARAARDEVLARAEAGGRHAAPDYNDILTNTNN